MRPVTGVTPMDSLEKNLEQIRRHLRQRSLRIIAIAVMAVALAVVWVWALTLAMRAEALVKSEQLANGSLPMHVLLVVYSAAKLHTQVMFLGAALGVIVGILIAEVLNLFSSRLQLLVAAWEALRRIEGELNELRRASEGEQRS
jgi:hypothetical protein